MPIDTVGICDVRGLEYGLAQILAQSQDGDGVPRVRIDCEDYDSRYYYRWWHPRGEDDEENFDEEEDEVGFEDEEPLNNLNVVVPPPPWPIV